MKTRLDLISIFSARKVYQRERYLQRYSHPARYGTPSGLGRGRSIFWSTPIGTDHPACGGNRATNSPRYQHLNEKSKK